MQAVPVDELKMQFASNSGERASMPSSSRVRDGGVKGRLTKLDSAPRSVDFPGSQPALLANEENFPVTNNKKQRCTFLWPPGCPIEFHRTQTVANRAEKHKPGGTDFSEARPLGRMPPDLSHPTGRLLPD